MQADCTHIQTHEGQSQGNAMKKITNGEINSSYNDSGYEVINDIPI